MDLTNFVLAHTERGECTCGRCIDVGAQPDPAHPHTIDMVFFKVAPRNHPAQRSLIEDEFKNLTIAHKGCFGNLDPFDGAPHSYLEIGAWIGDQGIAMQFMALGTMLGVFELMTPHTVLGMPKEHPLTMELAGAGYLAVRAPTA